MIITANKQWWSRLWPVAISASFMVYVPQRCVLFSCGSDIASSKNAQVRLFAALQLLLLIIHAWSSRLKRNLQFLHDLVVVSSIMAVVGTKLVTRAAHRLVLQVDACSQDYPSCCTNVSHLPTTMAAKGAKRQLPDVLHESEGMKSPRARLWWNKNESHQTLFSSTAKHKQRRDER